MDELWANKAVEEFNKQKNKKVYSLAEVEHILNKPE
jgi:hypothetical protein